MASVARPPSSSLTTATPFTYTLAPVVIWGEWMTFLKTREKLGVEQVCRSWHSMSLTGGAGWRTGVLDVRAVDALCPVWNGTIPNPRLLLTNHVRVLICDYKWLELAATHGNFRLASCYKLTLNLDQKNRHVDGRILTATLPALRQVHVYGKLIDDVQQNIFLPCLNAINRLSISGRRLVVDLPGGADIQSLDLRGVSILSALEPVYLLALTHVVLTDLRDVTEYVIRAAPNIESLRCFTMCFSILKKLATLVPRLRHLAITLDSRDYFNMAMCNSLAACTNLETLRFGNIVAAIPLHKIVTALWPLRKLRHLSVLRNCSVNVVTSNQRLLAQYEAHGMCPLPTLNQMWKDTAAGKDWLSHGIGYSAELASAVEAHNILGGCLQSVCGRSTTDWSPMPFVTDVYLTS